MSYSNSAAGIALFFGVVGAVLALFVFIRRNSKRGAAPVGWWMAGVSRAGSYATGTFFIGISGTIAFYGYDGFLYAIGIVAGALFSLVMIAEPVRRSGKRTVGGALLAPFPASRSRAAAAVVLMIVTIVFLVPAIVAAQSVIHVVIPSLPGWALPALFLLASPLFFGKPGTARIRFIRTVLLLVGCVVLVGWVLRCGLVTKPEAEFPRRLSGAEFVAQLAPTDVVLPNDGAWGRTHYVRIRRADGSLSLWSFVGMERFQRSWPAGMFSECQCVTETPSGKILINGLPAGAAGSMDRLQPMGWIYRLPGDGPATGALNPLSFLATIQQSDVVLPRPDVIVDEAGKHTIYGSQVTSGQEVLTAGSDPALFPRIRTKSAGDQLNFISFMIALMFGAAVMPGVVEEIGTQQLPRCVRKEILTAMIIIALFGILMLYAGLGAMTCGWLNPADKNVSVQLLARSFGTVGFSLFCAVLLLGIVGGISDQLWSAAEQFVGNILPRSRPVDALGVPNALTIRRVVGLLVLLMIACGFLFRSVPIACLIGWALNISAAAILPAILSWLYWKRATAAGMLASMLAGLVSSLVWIAMSRTALELLLGYRAGEAALRSPVPFDQPALVTAPLAFLMLIVVSYLTKNGKRKPFNAGMN